ncbi:hypothetical protein AAW14_15795 [Streptomyces hygroscopicus]|nr:hypothetical protein [Streptomyces hygroscopicus]
MSHRVARTAKASDPPAARPAPADDAGRATAPPHAAAPGGGRSHGLVPAPAGPAEHRGGRLAALP